MKTTREKPKVKQDPKKEIKKDTTKDIKQKTSKKQKYTKKKPIEKNIKQLSSITVKPIATKLITSANKYTFKGVDGNTYEITEKQKTFAELYMDPAYNPTQAVIDAGYNVETRQGNINYNLARTIAYENLSKFNISQYITTLIEEFGLNDQVVDKHLLYNVTQYASLEAKNKAIDIYNKMKGRYAPEKYQVSILDKLKGYSDQELQAIIEGEVEDIDL